MLNEQNLLLALEDHCLRNQCDSGGIAVVHGPGRINIIGEHTDYNDGFVLPVPLRLGITALSSKRLDNTVVLFSKDFPEAEPTALDDIKPGSISGWIAYPLGVIQLVRASGVQITGLEISFTSDLPMGAGLSSSAALEVATLRSLKSHFSLKMTAREEVLICRRAEHEFAKVKCGIMDQMASHLGKLSNAMLIDCQSLDYSFIPLQDRDFEFVAMDSGVKHSLRESGYNTRRQECETVLQIITQCDPSITSFRNLTLGSMERYRDFLPPVLWRRLLHIMTENGRVHACVEALKNDDLPKVGVLLTESHRSLSRDFEVSCPELDLLVELCLNSAACLGARMVGGGFGGSVLALMDSEKAESTILRVLSEYREQTGITARSYRNLI